MQDIILHCQLPIKRCDTETQYTRHAKQCEEVGNVNANKIWTEQDIIRLYCFFYLFSSWSCFCTFHNWFSVFTLELSPRDYQVVKNHKMMLTVFQISISDFPWLDLHPQIDHFTQLIEPVSRYPFTIIAANHIFNRTLALISHACLHNPRSHLFRKGA